MGSFRATIAAIRGSQIIVLPDGRSYMRDLPPEWRIPHEISLDGSAVNWRMGEESPMDRLRTHQRVIVAHLDPKLESTTPLLFWCFQADWDTAEQLRTANIMATLDGQIAVRATGV